MHNDLPLALSAGFSTAPIRAHLSHSFSHSLPFNLTLLSAMVLVWRFLPFSLTLSLSLSLSLSLLLSIRWHRASGVCYHFGEKRTSDGEKICFSAFSPNRALRGFITTAVAVLLNAQLLNTERSCCSLLLSLSLSHSLSHCVCQSSLDRTPGFSPIKLYFYYTTITFVLILT